MGSQVVAAVAARDERAQLDVLDGHLLAPHVGAQHGLNLLARGLVVLGEGIQFVHLLPVELLLEPIEHSVKGHFGRVGDVAEHGVRHISFDGFGDALRKLFAQCLAFLVDVAVRPSAEIDAFEGARLHPSGL